MNGVVRATSARPRSSLDWGGGAEAYLTAIHVLLQEEHPSQVVAARVAEYLGVSPASVSRALGRLQVAGDLVQKVPTLVLSAQGWEHAERLLRHHHIAECWLTDELGMDWTRVHQEAQRLGSAMSEAVAMALWEHLGRPQRCPHGTPIPGTDAVCPLVESLAEVGSGHYVIDRILEQVEDFVELLRQLKTSGLIPGASVDVKASTAGGQPSVRLAAVHDAPWIALQPWLARKVLVRAQN